jgi:predicted short-subunit dehydrogenase-like oxidoreductase (DUF2520 family)
MQSVTIIGAGRVGGALGIALERAGYRIDRFVVRSDAGEIIKYFRSAPHVRTWDDVDAITSDCVFITTQDSDIASAAQQLKSHVRNGAFVFHTSGALSSSVLDGLKDIGCHVGSIHPLVSISDPERGAEKLADSYFCLEGDAEAVAVAKDVVRNLGGKSFSIDTKYKALYHAAAVTAAGHVVALLSISLEMLERCGIDEATGSEIIKPLVKSTFDNFFELGPERALTGPFARADVGTFERHVKVIRDNFGPNVLEIYLLLAAQSLEIASERHRHPERFAVLLENVLIEKKRIGC